MIYYAQIDSQNKLIDIDTSMLTTDEYGSENVLNIEVSKEIYDNRNDYVYLDGEIVINPELDEIKLSEAKQEKIEQNDIARDVALNQGVLYKNVLFDSDTDQKVNLLATVSAMDETQTITWFGMDNQPLVCNKEDLINIGGLITMLHSFCWNKNAFIKAEISEAQTIEAVNEIEINYEMGEE